MCHMNFSKNTERQVKELGTSDMPKGNCVSECIANHTKIYRGNGYFDRTNLKRLFLNSVSGEKEWSNIVSNAADMCISESKSLTRHSSESFRNVT